MSGTLRRSRKHSETAVSQSGSSMHFWGVCCESGKQYAQVVGQRFRITMAVLDPKSFHNDAREKIVSLIVLRGGIEYLLCVLKHGEIHQVNLNLIFDKGENVKFYINGHGKVYLSGYQLTDSEGDVMNDENGYLCPLVEVKTKKKKSSLKDISMSPVDAEFEATSSNSRIKNKVAKPLWSSYISEAVLDDEDESDEDFSVGDEESGDDEEEASDDIEEEEDSEDLIEEESDEDEEDLEEEEIFQNSHEVRKRKKPEKLQPQKRSRNDSRNASTSMEKVEDVICIEDNESDETNVPFNINTSAGSTPIPKKQVNSETAFSEKKSKKEKKLREILRNIGEKEKEEQAESPNVTNQTPKQSKHPLVKLQGDVEIQDVIVGKGPIATKGKMLHVFFVGRLPDNSIFDSRLPGKKPFSFKLGAKEVIPGWEVALQGMRVGGRRKIKVPPSMAYGNRSEHGIPPNTTLRFVVDLQSVS